MGCFVLGHLSYRMFCQYDDLSVHLYSKIGAYGYTVVWNNVLNWHLVSTFLHSSQNYTARYLIERLREHKKIEHLSIL